MSESSLPEESIFGQALEIESAAERAAFLDRACGNNPALRAEVEALLRSSQKTGDILDLPEKPSVTTDLPAPEGPGTVIGPYKLLELIGEGGMGAVWMAEQTEPMQRRVAVKVVKEGMDSKQVLARFEAERQALAVMDHPNIAKVHDAGRTPSGRPYFVMELVKGQPITQYCDEKRLGVRERLELFGDVCRAVQHAHQKGIIHRDIKPSNVLVAPYDGKPVVKVIDFGVAKAVGQKLTEATLFTGFGAVVGTPEYMSPEQAETNNQDIDTRSDIYSLGVLLYELLTGSTPLTRKRIKEAALLEVLRVIREEEPPKPSTRLSSTEELPSVAAQRQTEPAKLTKLVRGELDWIVMKALEKDRNRRYETANGFALDVQRYLADEPVLACPPSAGYRLRKFVRRNKGPVVAASLVALTLVAGIVGTSWGLVRANKAHDDAVAAQLAEAARAEGERKAREAETAERRRAEENAKLAFGVLDDVINGSQQRLTLSTKGGQAKSPELEKLERELLTKTLAVYEKLAQSNATDWTGRRQRARAYATVGLLQLDLTNFGESEKAYRQAVHLMEELAGERPDDFDNAYDLADKYHWLYRPYWDTGRLQPAEEMTRHALALFAKLTVDFPERRAQIQDATARCQHNLGQVLQKAGKFQEAETAFRQAVAIGTELVAANPKNAGSRNLLAMYYVLLGELFQQTRRTSEAIDAWQQAVLVLEQFVAETNEPTSRWQLAGSLQRLGAGFFETGQPQEAEKYDRAAVAVWETLAAETNAPDHRYHLPLCHQQLGQHLKKMNRLREAITSYRAATPIWEKLVAEHPANRDFCQHLSWNYGWLTESLPEVGDHAEAAKIAEKLPALVPNDAQGYSRAVLLLARCAKLAEKDGRLSETARKAAVQAHLDKARELQSQWAKRLPNDAEALYTCASQMVAGPEPGLRDPAQAVDLLKKAVELAPKIGRCWSTLGVAQYRTGEPAKAIEALTRSLSLNGANVDDFLFLAMANWQQGQKDKARQWYQAAMLRMKHGSSQWRWVVDADSKQLWREAEALLGLDQSPTPAAPPLTSDDAASYTRIIAAEPDAAWAYQLRGQVHRRLGNAEQADADTRRAYELLTRNLPAGTDALKQLERAGSHYMHSNSWDMVVIVYSRLLELKGDNPWYYNERGVAYIVLGQYREGASDYSKEIARNPRHAPLYARRGYAYLRCGERDKALADYAQMLDFKPDGGGMDGWSRGFAFKLGAGLSQWKDDQAVARFFKAVDLDPEKASGWNGVAWLLATTPDAQSRDAEKAVRFAKRAVELAPNDGTIWNTLGAAHYRAGNWKDAIAALEKSMELRQGGDGHDWFFLAMARWQLGEKEKARTWFDQAVRWMDRNQLADEEMRRFRAEAAELLGIKVEKK
jgi:serine/threonine protein kinase/tetratricopeptide (TPR) repeat protein